MLIKQVCPKKVMFVTIGNSNTLTLSMNRIFAMAVTI